MAATRAQAFFTASNPEPFSPNRDGMMRKKNTDRTSKFLLIKQRSSKSIGMTMKSRSKIRETAVNRRNLSLTRTLTSYVDSGLMDEALSLFESMNNPDTFQWNVMIRGYTNCGLYSEAIDFYRKMRFRGVKCDHFTFPFVIKSCVGLSSLVEGCKVHLKLIKIGLDSDLYICNSLIHMYGKVGSIEFAERVFDEMPIRDLVSWNSMIGAYVSNGDGWSSLLCFREMQTVGLKPDRVGIVNALIGCCFENNGGKGKEIHGHALRNGLESNIMVQTSLVDMYCKCGDVDSADKLFTKRSCWNIVAYNAMIGGYAQNDQPLDALACFAKVQKAEEVSPDNVTMVNLLPACGQLTDLLLGKSIHAFSIRMGFLPHLVLETTLVDAYGKCGEPKLAKQVFDSMTRRNLISWNAMLAAYVHNRCTSEAIELFLELHNRGSPGLDAVTISSVLPAFSELAFLMEGMQMHAYAIKLGFDLNIFISNSIIYMYAKCGDIQTAREVFDRQPFKEVDSWNTIILAYAIHGFGRISIELFSKMQENCIDPNGITFASLLSACSISGMVDEGWKYFNSLRWIYGIDPVIEHYGCMVDLLGRTGNLESAKDFIQNMPTAATARIWGSLLAASRNNGHIELAEQVAEKISSLKHDNTGSYILLSNMYAQAGRWEDVERMKVIMKQKGIEKTTGCSTVELYTGKACSFIDGDKSHPETSTLYIVLESILGQIGESIYNPSIYKFRPSDSMTKSVSSPKTHSVRLALCFGLISTSAGTPILIRKNVRICEDCHSAIKRISLATRREIVVGDSRIYHHFRDGHCSCRDYW